MIFWFLSILWPEKAWKIVKYGQKRTRRISSNEFYTFCQAKTLFDGATIFWTLLDHPDHCARVTILIPLWKWLANERFPKRTQNQWATKSQHMQISWSLTGKSFSEEFILTSTNPQYDKKNFIELQVLYMKILSSEHVVYINCSEWQNKKQFVHTTCSEMAIFMYWTHK